MGRESAQPVGVRRVHPTPAPRSANPNTAQSAREPRNEGVRMVRRVAESSVARQEGLRCIRDEQGVPVRARNTPNAWPAWPGYPPSRDPKTGTPIDYALAQHGGPFRKVPPPPADVLASRLNCIRASNAPNEGMKARHAGERLY